MNASNIKIDGRFPKISYSHHKDILSTTVDSYPNRPPSRADVLKYFDNTYTWNDNNNNNSNTNSNNKNKNKTGTTTTSNVLHIINGMLLLSSFLSRSSHRFNLTITITSNISILHIL